MDAKKLIAALDAADNVVSADRAAALDDSLINALDNAVKAARAARPSDAAQAPSRDVIVRIKRPEDYEDVDVQIVVEDFIETARHSDAWQWEVIVAAPVAPAAASMTPVRTVLLYQHDDESYAVAVTAEDAVFTHGVPAWHRMFPVPIYGLSLPAAPAAAAPITRDAFYQALRAALKQHRRANPPRYLNDEQADASDDDFASAMADHHAQGAAQ